MVRPYHRKFPNTWWLKRRPYFLFMLREATAIFVAGYSVFLLVLLRRLGEGEEAFAAFLETLRSPLSLALHWVALAFALYHTVTWFNLTPKILVLRIGERKVPGALIAGANYVAWLALSAAVACAVLSL